MIDSFHGKYRFLSNFYPSIVHYDGIFYPSSEHAFQAAKSLELRKRLAIAKLESPGDAKKAGKVLELRPDWDLIRDQIMFDIVLLKFAMRDSIKNQLLATGDQELVEGNTWGDKYWGVCDGEGENKLGKILMKVRDILK